MQQPVKIDLTYSVEVKGQKVASVTMRGPKVRDLLASEKNGGGDAEREVMLFANLCELEPAVIEELAMADYLKLQEAYKGFFVLTAGECRRAVLALNSYTGWGYDALMDMAADELLTWLQTARDLYPKG